MAKLIMLDRSIVNSKIQWCLNDIDPSLRLANQEGGFSSRYTKEDYLFDGEYSIIEAAPKDNRPLNFFKRPIGKLPYSHMLVKIELVVPDDPPKPEQGYLVSMVSFGIAGRDLAQKLAEKMVKEGYDVIVHVLPYGRLATIYG